MIYSQHGEDGVLREMFLRLGPGAKTFVEFGVSEGTECNTALFAIEYKWNGLMIEGDPKLFARLCDNMRTLPGVKLERALVTRENIAGILRRADIPTEFDLLSIDIDGNDYWLWEALSEYRPRVVVIEYNASFPPPQRWVVPYDPDFAWDGTDYFGASLESLDVLGKRLGYALIGTNRHGGNAFFVRRDLIAELGFPQRSAAAAYHRSNYGPFTKRYPHRDGPSLEI